MRRTAAALALAVVVGAGGAEASYRRTADLLCLTEDPSWIIFYTKREVPVAAMQPQGRPVGPVPETFSSVSEFNGVNCFLPAATGWGPLGAALDMFRGTTYYATRDGKLTKIRCERIRFACSRE